MSEEEEEEEVEEEVEKETEPKTENRMIYKYILLGGVRLRGTLIYDKLVGNQKRGLGKFENF